MAVTPLQGSLIAQLEQTLGTAEASHRWRRAFKAVLDKSSPPRWSAGSRVAFSLAWSILTVYPAPFILPAVTATAIGARRERRRAQAALETALARAREVLRALRVAGRDAAFRGAANQTFRPADAADAVAQGCCSADRLLVLRASVVASTRRDPELVFNGVALTAVTANEARVAFAVWSADRDPSVDRLLEETSAAARERQPDQHRIEYWTWTRGLAGSLIIDRA